MADDKRVDEIRARLEKATPGEWVYRDGEYDGDDNGFYPANDTERVIGIYAPNNRDFIAHSKSDIEYLLSELAKFRSHGQSGEDLHRMVVASVERARAAEAENVRLRDALGFFASVIKSGEAWSEQCETVLNNARREGK